MCGIQLQPVNSFISVLEVNFHSPLITATRRHTTGRRLRGNISPVFGCQTTRVRGSRRWRSPVVGRYSGEGNGAVQTCFLRGGLAGCYRWLGLEASARDSIKSFSPSSDWPADLSLIVTGPGPRGSACSQRPNRDPVINDTVTTVQEMPFY